MFCSVFLQEVLGVQQNTESLLREGGRGELNQVHTFRRSPNIIVLIISGIGKIFAVVR